MLACHAIRGALYFLHVAMSDDESVLTNPHAQAVQVEKVLVYYNDDAGKRDDVKMTEGRDVFWQDEVPRLENWVSVGRGKGRGEEEEEWADGKVLWRPTVSSSVL